MSVVCLLAEYPYLCETFPEVDVIISELKTNCLHAKPECHQQVCQILLNLIQAAPDESFLLSSVLDFIHRIQSEAIAPLFNLTCFEFWLNQHSGLTFEENERVRGRITGKYIPREDYQNYFPVGMNKCYFGSHFVSAHFPPDLDTTVASFWGWVDAFGARVCKNIHYWNIPGGHPPRQAAHLFEQLFGPAACSILPTDHTEIKLVARDLACQQGIETLKGEAPVSQIDHGRHEKLVILTNEWGGYEGCWCTDDVEVYHLVALLLRNTWRWFENQFQIGLLRLFAASNVRAAEVKQFVQEALKQPLNQTHLIAELSAAHARLLDSVLREVLKIQDGLAAHGEALIESLKQRGLSAFGVLLEVLNGLSEEPLFDTEGQLTADRSSLMERLGTLQRAWQETFVTFCGYFDRLDVALSIKYQALGQVLEYVTADASLAQVRERMRSYQFLPVVEEIGNKGCVLMGVIRAIDLERQALATATLRDFCNREEVNIPSHIEVISVVDHHRITLQTRAAPTALVGDVQSCNVLLAEQAFVHSDRYGSGLLSNGMEAAQLDETNVRLRCRIAQRQLALETRGPYFIHPKREFAEYLSLLYAILDDTDLLSRVSVRDVLCVANLLNRLKSLIAGREVECVSFEDIPRDLNFVRQAARRLLQNEDMYSLYCRIYSLREREVERDIASCLQGFPSNVFIDTKEQKGCARVGQTKLFANNFPALCANMTQIRELWLQGARDAYHQRPEIDLHIQMITTLSGAHEAYHGATSPYQHCDELWIWIPSTEVAMGRLAAYLRGFSKAPEVAHQEIQVELMGPESRELRVLFENHFPRTQWREENQDRADQTMAVLRFGAATITSRKTSITPYIPNTDAE